MASKFGGIPVTGSRFGGIPVSKPKWAAAPEAPPKPEQGFLGDLGTLLKQGASQAMSTYQVGPQVISGNVEGTEGIIAKNLAAERFQPEALRQVSEAFKDEGEAMRQAESWYSPQGLRAIGGTVAEIGKQLATNPRGIAYFTAEQAANMVPAIVGGLSGAAAGSPAGPVGAVGGGAVGAFGASAPMEIGAEFIGIVGGELAARNLEPTEENIKTLLADEQFRSTAVSQARVKGATVAATDAAFSMFGGKLASAPARKAIADAARESLETGADAADLAKRNLDALPLSEKLVAGAKGYGADVVGAGVGETAGQVAAYGEADLEEVALEVLGEAGGAIVEVPGLGKKFVSVGLRAVQPGESIPVEPGSGLRTVQPGEFIPVEPGPVPAEVSPEQATTFARTRLRELITKGKGTPDISFVDPATGQTRTTPGRPAEILSDDERTELEFLANNAENPSALGKAYNLKIKGAAEQRLNEAATAADAVQAAADMVDMDIEALEREAGLAPTPAATPTPAASDFTQNLAAGRGLLQQVMPTSVTFGEPPAAGPPEPTLTAERLMQADISTMPAPERQEFLSELTAARTANPPEQRQSALTRAAEVYGRTVGPIQGLAPAATGAATAVAPAPERVRTERPDMQALLQADTRSMAPEDRTEFVTQLNMAQNADPGPVQQAALTRAAEVYGRTVGPIQGLAPAATGAATAVAPAPTRRSAVPRPTNILGRPTSEYTESQLEAIIPNDKPAAVTRRGAEVELRARAEVASTQATGAFAPTMAPTGAFPQEGTVNVERFITVPETVPFVATQPVAGQSAGQRARAAAQRSMDKWASSRGVPSPVTFNPAPADLEAGVAEIADLIGSQLGGQVVAFSDTRPGAINGVAIGKVAFVNVSDNQAGVPRTALHEFKHTVEQIAKAEAAAGMVDTPAQEFVEQIDSVFGDITEEGKRAYLENFLAAEELSQLQGDAREARVQELLQDPELRSEMTADFLGNRATDKKFWQDLAKADPTGFEAFVNRWLAAVNNLLATLRGAKNSNKTESAKVDSYIRDLNKAKLTAQSALINYRKATQGQTVQATQGQTVQAPQETVTPDALAATSEDVTKAEAFEDSYGILPYTSAGQLTVDANFSIKQSGDFGTHPILGIPINKNGSVSLYFPTDNATAQLVRREKLLRASDPSATRVFLTNESSAPKVAANPGDIQQPMAGANVLVQVNPDLVQLLKEHPDGRKDFFIPIAEGATFKAKMTKLFTLNAPRDQGLHPDRTLAEINDGISATVNRLQAASTQARKVIVSTARKVLRADHNVGTLLGENDKLAKTRTGDYGIEYNGKRVYSLGLGLASAQKINNKQKLTSCPQSAICESLCLGETSGQNLLYGGVGQFRSGPRLAQYLKTEAMVVHPEEFTSVLYAEIASFRLAMMKEGKQPTVRLNVTSDFAPKVWEPLIKAFPDVMFYDYTKLATDPIAENHHLTYSSTGASQIVDGKLVENKLSNWPKMVQRLREGKNVAMAFTSKTDMPDFIVDEATGERFQVWNGDNYDARFLDPKPGDPANKLNKGMIVGLTNKDRTGDAQTAAARTDGFFMDYDRKRDGDTLTIRDPRTLGSAASRPVKIQFSRSQKETSGVIKATPGVDMVRMARLLGPQLYGNMSDIGLVTIKEVFQNSFDALKGAIQKGDKTRGLIDVEVDSYARTITITDDGTGMTPEIINKAFLTLAGTSKETDRASGGLGIAKMLFLFGNESLSLRTVRNGVESTLSTSGAELMASFSDPAVAPNIQTRPTSDPSGTAVTIKIPETYTDENGEVQSIDFPYKWSAGTLLESSPLLENIEVRLNGETLPIGANFPVDDYTVLANAKFAWGNMRVLVRPREASEASEDGKNMTVLSNGLYQFGDTLKKNPLDFWGPAAPFQFYLNIEPTVPADSPLYPIALNRKGFSMSAKSDFEALKKYLSVLYANKNDAESAQSFGELEQLSEDGKTFKRISLVVPEADQGSTLAINPGDKVEVREGRMYVNNREMPEITKESMAKLVRDPGKFRIDPSLIDPSRVLVHDNLTLSGVPFREVMRDSVGDAFDDFTFEVADVFKTLRDATAKVGGAKYSDVSDVAVGVSFDLEYYGVNIMVPFRAMMINPAFIRGEDPAKAAQTVVGTMIHELVHHAERNHSETGFIPELQRMFMELSLSRDSEAITRQLQNVFNKYPDIMRELRRIQDNEKENLKPKGVRLKGDADTTGVGGMDVGQKARDGASAVARLSAPGGARRDDSDLPGVRRAVEGRGRNRPTGEERRRPSSADGGYDPGLAFRDLIPQFSRGQKDVLSREPKLESAAQGIKEGTVTREQYDELVNALKPVTPYESVPSPVTEAKIRSALSADKVDRIGAPSKTLKAGDPVGLRLDIPAYANHGVWVVSVHEQIPGFAAGKSIGYESVASVTNPTFGVVESAALNIAAGKPKATIAVMKGDWKPVTPKQASATAKLALKSDNWVQVGMDPTRHAYFYDRASMEPVVSADEAIQVGPLVLAKNPVYGNKEDFRFSRSQGETPSQQRGINVRNDGDNLYADLIVDGEKTMESRNTNSLRAYVGQTVGIIRTGEGPAKLIGSVKIGEPIEVDEQEFRELEPEHLVPEGSAFDIKPGSTKFLYPLTEARRFDEERAVDSRGIVARNVAFSRAQVNTPAFKRWFGDSKVVDAQGRPLRLYHGTPYPEFDQFSKDMIGENFGQDKQGFFFTTDPDRASDYAQYDEIGMPTSGGQVIPVYLSMKNPLVVKVAGDQDTLIRAYDKAKSQLLEQAAQTGHDGIEVMSTTGHGSMYVALEPTQIKSAIGNTGNFDPADSRINFSRAQASPMKLYSALAKAVEAGPARAPKDQWANILRKQKFVTEEEITWTGLEDWLEMQSGQVPREAVSEFLAQNGVQVGEVVLGMAAARGDFREYLTELSDEQLFSEANLEDLDIEDFDTREELITAMVDSRADSDYDTDDGSGPRYIKYQLPGGTNYREVLLTLPSNDVREAPVELEWEEVSEYLIQAALPSGNIVTVFSSEDGDSASLQVMTTDAVDIGEPQEFNSTDEAKAAAASMAIQKKQNLVGGFRSSHWDGTPNVLAHVRMNDRVDADGARVLFVEELQSDWAQEGRKIGFATGSAADAEMVATINNSANVPYWEVSTTSGDFVANVVDVSTRTGTPEQAITVAREIVRRRVDRRIPKAPFVQSTDSWLRLALKRVIAMAVEGGYDKIAFANGQQNADRYDLSKQIDRLEVEITAPDNYRVFGYFGSDLVIDTGVSEDELPNTIGKELAEKVIANRGGVYDVPNLKVGGEGMRAFYDNIVPKTLNKLLPKIGGGKVGTTRFGNFESPTSAEDDQLLTELGVEVKGSRPPTQPAITITREMTDQVMDAGLPLFSRRQNIFGQPMPAGTWQVGDSRMDEVIYFSQDKLVDTKRVVEAIGNVADKFDAYLQETLYHGKVSTRTTDFADGELKPLIEAMGRNKVKIEDLDEYLHNRHAEERNIAMAKRDPNQRDGLSGITTADAKAYLAAIPPARRALLEGLARRVDAITAGTRNALLNAGLESQGMLDAWENTYSAYVPLMREELDYDPAGGPGTGAGFNVRGGSSRRAVGSTDRRVVDILANVVLQRERAIVRAEKNRVSKALYGLAIQNPFPEFWLPINLDAMKDPAALQAELIGLGLSVADAQNIAQQPKERVVDPRTGLTTERPNHRLLTSANVITARVNGKDRFLVLNPQNPRAERMALALKNLDVDHLGRALGLIAQGTRWFASVNTQYNPIFGVINFLRDVQGGMLNLSSTELKGKQGAVLAGTVPALLGISAGLRTRGATGQWAQLWREFQEVGGQTGYRDQFSQSEERAKALESELKALSNGTAKKAGKAVGKLLSDYNTAMENAVRLSAYKAGLDKGMSKERAAALAKNLTVNFNKKGQVATQMGALYAFFNASVQGTARLLQTLSGPAGKKIIYGGLLLGSVQAMMMAMAGFDEEEPPEFVRERNLIIPTGDGKYLTLPMPLGFNVIPNFSRIVTEWALSGFERTPQRVAQIATSFFEMFNPIGSAGLSVQTLAPTVVDPLVAISENRDWTGTPIAREDFNSLDPTPGYTRAKDTASEFSKALAEFLNLASGGTEFAPGVISPTPDQLDYLIGQVTGGIGREYLKAEQTVTAYLTGEELPTYKIPLVGRFGGNTSGSSAVSSRFYESIRRMNVHNNELGGRREAGRPVGEYLRENPEARLAPQALRAYRQVQDLRRRKREMLERDASKESIRRIEAQITQRMQQFNDRLDRM